ncbi:MAG: ankyrin repeat domain-containing protein [Sulfurimonas sp.]|uniref:ankyrin repeat domain-containing protein n=1 Tax=Sulfurimonas sp. TaxID=2022749 RepID=UPI0026145983|nr:ankyrin repeat domain-containing protein [Sulfurimonas sp.]MCW8894414.1 ankyrin repeat domain-containing protein [Sulfurimonas sp.]MCW8953481.1 ankyrin repeat domain-containing protein [Sulfurimonas sp.]MCW9068351.1 ankyrin repeat domain-containing protein [Sulfurimonas sp.]
MNTFEKFEKIVYDNDFNAFKTEVEKLDDINIQNKYGWTLLHIAIRRDRREMVSFLLENAADINRVDGVGWTPLMEAIMDDMPDLVSLLVESGADKSIANARGVTAPMLAQKFERSNMYEYLK